MATSDNKNGETDSDFGESSEETEKEERRKSESESELGSHHQQVSILSYSCFVR